MQSTEYSTSSTTDFTTASTFSQSLTESIPTNDTYMITTESYYNIVTSSLKDTLSTLTTLSIHHDHTTVYSEFACVRSELSEPDFQLYACSGSKITSWIASIFLVTMSIFGIIKCLTAHGILNIFDLRRTGISFPKRPEFFVLTCSSLPLVFSVLSRPLFTPLSPTHKYFILGWGMAQTRFFCDLFTRTASIYHLVYWVYRTPIINLIWHICFICKLHCNKLRDETKRLAAARKTAVKTAKTSPKRYSKQPVGRGRTSEWGYTDKRRKSRSSKSVRGTTETVAATPNSSSINTLTNTNEINDPTSQVANSGGINLISAQPLFIDQNNVLGPPNQLPGMMPNLSGLMNPYGQMIPQNMMVTPDNYNMFNNGPVGQQLGQQANPYAMNMGYGMGYGMTMNMNNYINQVNAYNQPNFMYPMNGAISPDIPKDTINNTINNDKPPINDTSEKVSTIKTRSKIEVPLPTKQFLYHCKRIIPGCIYIISFIITLPSITAFEPIEEDGMILTRCTTMCRSYFYYDLVVLVTMPTISLIIAFYYSSLSKKQINGELKMTYRLRCYYVTFILLNIPMFVLMLTSIGFRLSEKPYRNIYGTGILIAMTAYHTNFALKSTIYTTGCNCICCSDYCLMKYPKINRLIISFTTPVAIKDKEALLEGIVIPVLQ
uniref:G_PROTEIN_RECEP_F1_2 domain-containing protein n=1 Tax=Schistosoma mansoni TaxID=6183 RepID=A0A3Q0KRE3_SCHMA